jgi:hypothetical protein
MLTDGSGQPLTQAQREAWVHKAVRWSVVLQLAKAGEPYEPYLDAKVVLDNPDS